MQNKILSLARKDLQRGDTARAARHYRRLVGLEPENPSYLLKFGDLSQRLGEEEPAADAYARAAWIYARDSFDDKAIALYKRALELDPTRFGLWSDLADAYLRVDRLGEAIAGLAIAAELLTKADRPAEAAAFRARITALGGPAPARSTQAFGDTQPIIPLADLDTALATARACAREGNPVALAEAFQQVIAQKPDANPRQRALCRGLNVSDVDAVERALEDYLASSSPDVALDVTGLLLEVDRFRTYESSLGDLYRDVAEMYRVRCRGSADETA